MLSIVNIEKFINSTTHHRGITHSPMQLKLPSAILSCLLSLTVCGTLAADCEELAEVICPAPRSDNWDENLQDLLDVQISKSAKTQSDATYLVVLKKGLASKLVEANKQLQQHHFAEAAALFQYLVDHAGTTPSNKTVFLHRLALCFFQQGKNSEAEKAVDLARQSCNQTNSPKSKELADILFLKSQLSFARHSYNTAADYMQQALQIEGKSRPHRAVRMAQTLSSLAWCEFENGNYVQALRRTDIANDMYKARTDANRELWDCFYLTGNCQLGAGRASDARISLRQAVALSGNAKFAPEHMLKLYSALARTELELNNLPAAAEMCNKAEVLCSNDPNNIDFLLLRAYRGIIKLRENRTADAEDSLRLLVSGLPPNEQNLPVCLQDFGVAPSRPIQLDCKGDCHSRIVLKETTGQYAGVVQSLAALADVLRRHPETARLCTARALLKQSAELARSLKLAPGETAPQLCLEGWINALQGNYDLAVKQLSEYRERARKRTFLDAHYEALCSAALMRCYIRTGNLRLAGEMITELTRLSDWLKDEPMEFQPEYLTALLCFSKGDYALATNHLSRCKPRLTDERERRVDADTLAFAIGGCLLKENRTSDAEKYFKRVTEDGALRQEALQFVAASKRRSGNSRTNATGSALDGTSTAIEQKNVKTLSHMQQSQTPVHQSSPTSRSKSSIPDIASAKTAPSRTRRTISQSVRKHWDLNTMPLRVCAGNETFLSENDQSVQDLVADALTQWCRASGGALSFKFVDLPTTANLYVCLRRGQIASLSQYCSGYCNTESVRDTGVITRVQVIVPKVKGEISKFGAAKRRTLQTTLLHELGHALGLEHSTNPRDIMFPLNVAGRSLSTNDAARIRQLYKK